MGRGRISLVLPVALAVALPPALPAQGAKESSVRGRVGAATASPAPAAPASHAQPARGVLATLVGTWRFAIWFAGNYGGAPDATGTRVVRPLFDDLRLDWTEAFDHSPVQGQGIVGFDPTSDRFFWNAVYSAGAAPELLTGALDDAQPTVAFRPVGQGGDTGAVATLAVVDEDHITWIAPDRAWRAVFTRQR